MFPTGTGQQNNRQLWDYRMNTLNNRSASVTVPATSSTTFWTLTGKGIAGDVSVFITAATGNGLVMGFIVDGRTLEYGIEQSSLGYSPAISGSETISAAGSSTNGQFRFFLNTRFRSSLAFYIRNVTGSSISTTAVSHLTYYT